MNFKIEKFNIGELDSLAKETNLDENIDYQCEFIVARNGSIAGVAGVNFIKQETPRFEHIIISPEYQKTKLGGILMIRTERHLKDLGYKQYTAFILKTNKTMQDYAIKFGFQPYLNTINGIWFYKNIGG